MGIISSNTLFHWTDKDSLIGILENEFKINYCREDIFFSSSNPLKIMVPMVSFCDIPLSDSKNQMEEYGQYGIGLKKEWGIQNGLNPVLYIVNNSNLMTQIQDIFMKDIENKEIDSKTMEIILELLVFFKNHKNELNNGDNKYEFYKEREWRYVPKQATYKALKLDYWNVPKFKKEYLNIIKELRLGFTPNDISYLILKEEDEIYDFIGHIQEIKGQKYSKKEVQLLTTKIITSENILSDF